MNLGRYREYCLEMYRSRIDTEDYLPRRLRLSEPLLMFSTYVKWFVGIGTGLIIILFLLIFSTLVPLNVFNWIILQESMPGLTLGNGLGSPEGTSTSFLEEAEVSSPATGPLVVHPTNPRYFTDGSGKAVFLTGSHTWDNFQDLGTQDFDYSRYLNLLQDYNHNFIKLWVWEQPKGITTWPDPAEPLTTLTPEIFARTGPGTAADGGQKFDLTQYNQAHFDRLRQRIIDAGDLGIYVSVMLFDGWSIEQKSGGANPWIYHPFNQNNNVNGIDGDPNNDQSGSETHTLQMSEVTTLQEAYVRKVIDTVNDLDNVLYEISNESNTDSIEWQYHMIEYIKSYEATKLNQHPVGMTVPWPGGDNAGLFDSPADWIAPNGDDGYCCDVPAADGSKVIILDTDHIWGIGGDRYWAWKSFMRGMNVIYMDPWDGAFIPVEADEDLRVNMGYILTYADRIDLAAMNPRGDLCSTGYCLANPTLADAEYLVYAPEGGTIQKLLDLADIDRDLSVNLPTDRVIMVDLTATPGELSVEWFHPETGEIVEGGTITGGASHVFVSPFSGDAVLYLYQTTEDKDPPIISDIADSVLASNAFITWATDEAATSQVAYGLSPSLTMSTTKTTDLVVSHKVGLTDLAPETMYYYQIYSEDVHGNEATSEVLNFTTLATADVTKIYIPFLGFDVLPINARASSCRDNR
ncbi:MAG: fibronectin type III domain-containing protein [Anaerolineales bacterium]